MRLLQLLLYFLLLFIWTERILGLGIKGNGISLSRLIS